MQFATTITGPVAVIGDVHGQTDHLLRVLDQLTQVRDFERRWVIFIGDLVDRGPDSKGVMEIVTGLMKHHSRTTAVAGNHELAMAAALGIVDAPAYTEWSERWLEHYGSEETFRSYGVENVTDLAALLDAVPQDHRDYLANVPWCIEHPEYFFVHAGLEPAVPFGLQREILEARDFTLNRPAWLCSKSLVFEPPPRDCPKQVVSGHAQVPEVQFQNRRILIDTTGGEGGSLSCVLLPENEVIHSHPELVMTAPEPEYRPHSRVPETVPEKRRGWLW